VALAIVALALAAMLAVAGWLALGRESAATRLQPAAASDAPLLLFTSLPIYWGEAPDLTSMLASKGKHWARAAIEERRGLRPLDTLEAETLGTEGDLLMIQPRPLSPQENVALDAWVAAGGRLLLFADPALTEDSAFAIGDRRRPQDVVLLSPILARWGLGLEFDEDQPLGERGVGIGGGASLPVNLPGRFVPRNGGRADAKCTVDAVIADCRIGSGRVVAIADAALFEAEISATRQRALDALMAWAFAR
jgi:hypothetical protein